MCQPRARWHVLLAAVLASAGCGGDAARGDASGRSSASDARGAARADGAAPVRAAGDAGVAAKAALLSLIPAPRRATTCAGNLVIDAVTEIVVDDAPEVRPIATRLAQWLDIPASRVRVIAAGAPGPARAIVLRLDPPPGAASPDGPGRRDPALEPPREALEEAYTLDVSPERVLVRAAHPAGLFYGAQTVAQLAGSRPIVAAPALAVAHLAPSPGASEGPPALTPAPPAPSAPPGAPARQGRVLPCVHIEDAPGQRVRAMHLDVARHFFSKELVERYVDILAFYRFNVFHWHLTDDQGFRLAIRSHPELTQIGASRIEDGREHAGFYSQDDAREVVAWARDRFVTVVPEIEMPGHARALLASHPELSCTGKRLPVPSTWGVFDDVLCAGNPKTFALLGDVLRETTEVFPSQLVHVGGDEVPKTRWNACPKCRARMARDKLTAEQLQGAFMKRAGELLTARGRRMVAWDDVLEGGAPTRDTVVVAWQNAGRGREAVVAGQDVVMAPAETNYFNYWQSRSGTEPGHEGFVPWPRVLAFDPRPPGLDPAQAAHVLGGEGALWTEYVRTADELDTLLLPRLGALAEALWRSAPFAAGRPVALEEASFVSRFTAHRPMLDASGVRYFVEPPLGLRARKVLVEEASLVLAPPALHPDGVVRFTLDGSDPSIASPVFTEPITLRASTRVAARLFLPGGRASEVVRGTFVRSSLLPPIQPSLQPSMLREGVLYKYFEGELRSLPDFAHLKPKRTGRLGALGFEASFRPERFGVLYEAWVLAPEDGVYRFVAHADDGVSVDVDGVRIVADDGEHAARDAEGEIALARGPHTVRIGYFQGGGGKQLALRCEGPGLPLGPCRLVSP